MNNDNHSNIPFTVHVINRMEIGGVEVGVLSLLKSKLYKNFHVLTVKGCDMEIYTTLSDDEKSRLHVCNGYIEAILKLIRLSPNLVVSSLWRSHFVSMIFKLFKGKSKRIHFVHNANFGHLINKLISILSIRFSNAIFTDSDRSNKWLKSKINIGNSIVVPMNVSFSDTKRKFCENDFSFVFVGRFCKQKNIKDSFIFIERLIDGGIYPSFDLFGRDDGELLNLKQYVDRNKLNKHIRFHDSVLPTQEESKMQEFNFYLQTSIIEGMAISVFQSIKNGLFPLVTPVGEISSYTLNKSNAFYIDTSDIDKSAKDFIKLIRSNNIDVNGIGRLANPESYPEFDRAYFDELQVLSKGM